MFSRKEQHQHIHTDHAGKCPYCGFNDFIQTGITNWNFEIDVEYTCLRCHRPWCATYILATITDDTRDELGRGALV